MPVSVVDLAANVRANGGWLKVSTTEGFYFLRPTQGELKHWTWEWYPKGATIPKSIGWSLVRNRGPLLEIDNKVVRSTSVEIVR